MPVIDTPVYRIALGVTLAGVLEIIWLNFFLRREGVNISLVYDLPGLFKSEDIRVFV